MLFAVFIGHADAAGVKDWPVPVWALATTCDDKLNCWKIATRVPDVILRHSESVSDCTMWINKITGGTQIDKTGKVFHVITSCAVSNHEPQGYTIKK